MRFPNLDLSEIASGGSIQEATISVRDLMCQSLEINASNCCDTGGARNTSDMLGGSS